MSTFAIYAAAIDDPIASAATAEDAIDALLVEALYSVGVSVSEGYDPEDVAADAAQVERFLHPTARETLAGLLSRQGRLDLWLDCWEDGFQPSLTVLAA